MQKSWYIKYYESGSGKKPVEDFIDSLEEKSQEKIVRTLQLLEEFGIALGLPHVKKLSGTSLWELRVLGGDNLRIFYIAMELQTFLLLHAFKKKTQKTEKKEIKIATERLQEHRLYKELR